MPEAMASFTTNPHSSAKVGNTRIPALPWQRAISTGLRRPRKCIATLSGSAVRRSSPSTGPEPTSEKSICRAGWAAAQRARACVKGSSPLRSMNCPTYSK